jgi:hypothetical protein
MNMKKLIQTMTDIEKGKTPLNESVVDECGDMAMPAPAAENLGNPVTASITLNASGMDHVADLMRLLQQAGLEKAGPVSAPPPPMRTDMENLRDKMAGLEGGPSEPKPQYFDVGDVTGGGDDIHSKKEPEDIRIKDSSLADDVRDSEIEEWDNEPEEEYQDHSYMLKDLSGGINREKRQYRAAQPGDNAMAAESIKDRLYKALSEKKAKPDYLDLDGDGDTKEPMKKAAKDAKKKKTNEADDADRAVQQALSVSKIKRDAQKARHGINRKPGESLAAFIARADKLKKKNAQKTTEAEVQAPTHELSDVARQATRMAQKIKRKINSGEPMEDRDYNQLAELGAVLSKFGASYGPTSMKDVMTHMKQYTDDRNQEGHGYPEFDVNRFKELISMAKSTGESSVSEISPDLAKRYTKRAKMDRDFNDDDLERLPNKVRHGTDDQARQASDDMARLQRRNAKRTKGINRAAKRM